MPQKVLIIDDDRICLKAIALLLADSKYIIETFEDSEQAWQQLLSHPHDYALILTDRLMFGVDALELLSRRQQFPPLHSVPIIVFTGEAEPDEEEALMQAGAFAFLYKPIEKTALLEIIAKGIGKRE